MISGEFYAFYVFAVDFYSFCLSLSLFVSQKLEKQQFSQIVVLEIRENLENLIKQFYSIRNAELQWMIKERVASMEKVRNLDPLGAS